MQASSNAIGLIQAAKSQSAITSNDPNSPDQLIEGFEGCRLHAYLDSAAVATIGWGCTYYLNGTRVKMGDVITQPQADAMLVHVVAGVESEMMHLVHVPLTQNQYDALTSFTYNEGIGALGMSTLLKKLNAKDYAGAANEFTKWDEITNPNTHQKEVLNDLYVRRTKERALFLKP